jgi:hypothetical protein
MMKPEIFYEKGHNKDGNPVIKRTQRLKKPVINNTGRLKGYFQEERVNYISGTNYSNGIAKISQPQYPTKQHESHYHKKVPQKTIMQMINGSLERPQHKKVFSHKHTAKSTSSLNQLIKKLYLNKQKAFNNKPVNVIMKKPTGTKKKPTTAKKKKPTVAKKKPTVAKKKSIAAKKVSVAAKKESVAAKKKSVAAKKKSVAAKKESVAAKKKSVAAKKKSLAAKKKSVAAKKKVLPKKSSKNTKNA